MFVRPIYHLTFSGEPEYEHGRDNHLPVGEEIARLLVAELPKHGLSAGTLDEGNFCWKFLIELGDYCYTVELVRPFQEFGRDEWLAVVTPNISRVTFLGKPTVDPERVATTIRKVLLGTGRYHSCKLFVKGRKGGDDWANYPDVPAKK